jgi:DNA replication protein DnaC
VLFVTAAHVLLDLRAQKSARAPERRLKCCARVGLLMMDEIGYLAFDAADPDLLYRVIAMRYEKKSSCSRPTSPSRSGRGSFRARQAPSR